MTSIAVQESVVESFVIEGGHRLSGHIRAEGNKNGALPILAACLLTEEPVVLHNVPRILDVETMLALLEQLGADVDWLGANEVRIQAADLATHEVHGELASRIRASFLLAGPLLARFGRAKVPPPGGDVIGRRRLDPHIHAFAELGAEIHMNGGYELHRQAPRRARPPRRGVGHGDRERDHGRVARARPDDDLERGVRAARPGPLPLPRLARRARSRASART